MSYSIPYQSIFILSFLLSLGGMSQAQNFENGNLEGENNPGLLDLPDFWEKIPHTDVNCIATNANSATPAFVYSSGPFLELGYAGIPFSGSMFVGGGYGFGGNGLFFHEGIMQSVNDFDLGESYTIQFYQSIIRTRSCRDTSGSWAVFLNDSLIGITAPTISFIPYMSINLDWEEREISFIATEESYLIKFLPWDDDTNNFCDSTLLDGSLNMGIDCIRLNLSTSLNEGLMEQDEVNVYPNPTTDYLNIDLNNHNKFKSIQIIDVQGRVLREYLSPVSNQMRLELPDATGVYLIKVVTEKGSSIHKILKI